MNTDHNPVIYELPNMGLNLAKKAMNPVLSEKYDYPQFKYGFHHYLHTNNDKIMEIKEEFKGRKKVYNVLHPFNPQVDEFDGIEKRSEKYLDLKGKPSIISNDFYKLWEMMMTFGFADEKNVVSAHLAEGPGSFVQAVIHYREKFFSKDAKKDQYYSMTLHSEADGKYVPSMNEDFVKYYRKKGQYQMHRTYSRKESTGKENKDNGDITHPKSIMLFGGAFNIDKKCTFITADAGHDFENLNTQEQESTRLILGQILGALRLQAKGGNFVCRMHETYSDVLMKSIALLTCVYKNVTLYKPLISKKSEPEKYFICQNFILDDKQRTKLIKEFELALTRLYKDKTLSITSIFPSFELNKNEKGLIAQANGDLSNRQLLAIGDIFRFIEGGNFQGSTYETAREDQMKATQYWVNHFFPDAKDYSKAIKKIQDINKKLIDVNKKRVDMLNKKLV